MTDILISKKKENFFNTPPVSPTSFSEEKRRENDRIEEEKEEKERERLKLEREEREKKEEIERLEKEEEQKRIESEIITEIEIKTPIRKKKEFKEIPNLIDIDLNTPVRLKNPPVKTPVRTPMRPDYSDDENVNIRVRYLVNNPNEITYANEDERVVEAAYKAFKTKYENLKLNYPNYDIEYPENSKIDKIHIKYHTYIKDIYVNLSSKQTELGYASANTEK